MIIIVFSLPLLFLGPSCLFCRLLARLNESAWLLFIYRIRASLYTSQEIPTGVSITKWIAACIEEAVVGDDDPRIGHHRIRGDEGGQRGVVVAGVVVEEAAGGALLAGEGMVGLEVARCAAFGAVGVVPAAGCRGPCAGGGQRGAGGVVAVQVVEVAAALDRGCAGCRRCSG